MEGQAERPYSPRVRGSGSIWRQWVHREQSDLICNINYGGSRWTIMETVDKLDRHLGRSGMCLPGELWPGRHSASGFGHVQRCRAASVKQLEARIPGFNPPFPLQSVTAAH